MLENVDNPDFRFAYKNYSNPLISYTPILGTRPWELDSHRTIVTKDHAKKIKSKHIHSDYARPSDGNKDFKFEYRTRPEVRLTKPETKPLSRTGNLPHKIIKPREHKLTHNNIETFAYSFDKKDKVSPYKKMLFANNEYASVRSKMTNFAYNYDDLTYFTPKKIVRPDSKDHLHRGKFLYHYDYDLRKKLGLEYKPNKEKEEFNLCYSLEDCSKITPYKFA